MPWVGSSKMKTSRARLEPLRQHHLLLVAAREVPDRVLGVGDLDLEALDQVARGAALLRSARHGQQAGRRRKRRSDGSVMFLRTEKVRTVPWLRRSSGSSTTTRAASRRAARGCAPGALARAPGPRRRGRRRRSAARARCAPRRRGRRCRARRRRAATKLASSTTPGRRQPSTRSSSSRSVAASRRAPALRPCPAALAPGDVLDQLAAFDLRGRRLEDHPAVAHHGDVVGDVEDLLEPVGDVERSPRRGRAASAATSCRWPISSSVSDAVGSSSTSRRALVARPRAITTSRRSAIESVASWAPGSMPRAEPVEHRRRACGAARGRFTNAPRHLRVAEPELDVLGHASGSGRRSAPGGRRRSPRRVASSGPWRRTGSPSTMISPSSGWTTPARILISVLLPAPFLPSRPTIAPGTITPSAWSSASTPG